MCGRAEQGERPHGPESSLHAPGGLEHSEQPSIIEKKKEEKDCRAAFK